MAAALVASASAYGARPTKSSRHELPPYYRQDGLDDLPFDNFCSCGKQAPFESQYCSEECRQQDSEHESAPDSPSVLPALVPSASKSTCSTPPSSATNSPSPRGMISDIALNDEPPRLDLGASVTLAKFYGGQSLPITMRFPTSKSWKAAHKGGMFAAAAGGGGTPHDVESHASSVQRPTSDLQFRRRASKPQMPAPLFYRESAAHVRSSPALGPISPTKATFWSPQLAPTSDITTLALPPLHSAASSSSALPPPVVKARNCGRPGCVGEPRKQKVSSGKPSAKNLGTYPMRRPSVVQQNGLRRESGSTNDILLSPRIRALRATDHPHLPALDDFHEDQLPASHQADDSRSSSSSSSSEDEESAAHTHSAFACYLFSHLSQEKERALKQGRDEHAEDGDDEVEERVPRGRTVAPAAVVTERGVSVDSASIPPRVTLRPTRFLFSRGPPQSAVSNETQDDAERTIRSRQTTARPKLEPGHFISATTDSPCDSIVPTPLPSSPSSPPTAGRGRSVTRRPSNPELDVLGDLPLNGRGRSQLRGPGAVLRSVSPSSRGVSESSSRGRHTSSSRARESGSRGRESRGRGRTSRTSTDDEQLEQVAETDEEDRGRGRGRDRSPSLRRLVGREIIISGAAYGHGSP